MTSGPGAAPSEPLVDLVIPVHDPGRPVGRAVRSVLAGNPDGVRVTVVCHGISRDAVMGQFEGLAGSGLRVVEFADGIPAPTGPFNHGLDLATGEYVGVMGSDDFLEPGAMDAWTSEVRRNHPDVLLAALRHQGAGVLRNPLVRAWRRHRLDPVKDRLFYRSSPLGLLRRSLVNELGLRFTEGVRSGGDLAISSRLWASGARIDLASDAACYVIGADADTRVTTAPMSAAVALTAVNDLARRDWLAAAPAPVRRALSIKLIRVHLLGAVLARPKADQWDAASVDAVRGCLAALLRLAPDALEPFPRLDRDLLDVLVDRRTGPSEIQAAVARHAAGSRAARLLPRTATRLFDREGVLVRYLLYAVDPGKRAAPRAMPADASAGRKGRIPFFPRA